MIPTLGRTELDEAEVEATPTRVLVLEEAPPVRNTLLAILAKLGISAGDVVQASTGEEALARFRHDPPHVVFTELVGIHPEDGLEVVLEMLDRAPGTKIVLVTAESRDSAEVRAAVRAGVFAVVEKPVRHEKIRAVLQDLDAEEGGIERFR